MWYAKIAAFLGGNFAKKAFSRIIAPLLLVAFGYFGVRAIVDKVSTVLNQSSQYQNAIAEANKANEDLAKKELEHAAELERLESDRLKLNTKHEAFRRAAVIENSKLKKALNDNEENKIWHNSGIPDDIKRLREQSKTTSAIPSKLESSTSSE